MLTGLQMIGRGSELSLFDSLCSELPDRGAALLLEGAPGVGKTALVEEFARRAEARSMQVLRTSGTIVESAVPFAGLHLLLRPLQDRFATLPPPQRGALEVAFGVVPGHPPTPFLAGLATLTLLSDAAAGDPVLVIADDLHWLDPASQSALLIAARRIACDPVIVVLAARPGLRDEPTGLRRVTVAPLTFIDANALLDLRPDRPHGTARRVLLELAAGNPLALVELPAAASTADPLEPVPLSSRLEQAFAGRLSQLERPVRLAVLAAALDDSCSVAHATSAAARAAGRDPDPAWLDAAVAAGLIEQRFGSLSFRHPLVRSAVLTASGFAERAELYRAFMTIHAGDPTRTIWWRAELAEADDAQLADELDDLGGVSLAGNDPATALRALRRSAALTADPVLRYRRQLRAAAAAARAGAYAVAEDLLAQVESETDDAAIRAQAVWQRELLPIERSALASGDFGPALAAIETMQSADQTDLALDAVLQLASIAWHHSTAPEPGQVLIPAVRSLRLDPDDPRMLLLAAVTDAPGRGDEVIDHIRRRDRTAAADAQTAWYLGYALNLAGEIVQSRAYLRQSVEQLRAAGRIDLLPHALMGLSWTCLVGGHLIEGRGYAEECVTIGIDLDDPGLAAAAQAALALFDAVDGTRPDPATIAGSSPLAAHALDSRSIRSTLIAAQGTAALVEGRPRDALESLGRLTDPHDPAYHLTFGIVTAPDLIDAALLAGARALALTRVDAVETLAQRWHAPLVRSALRYAHIALADEAALDRRAAELDEDPLPMPLVDARAHLTLGTRLRRSRRIAEARRQLHHALDAFEQTGARQWAARCRDELRATGERLSDEPPSGSHVLTSQELLIARLAIEGLTNRAIAERLFLSPRTVGSHLYAAYRKLGVTSRDQLESALATTYTVQVDAHDRVPSRTERSRTERMLR